MPRLMSWTVIAAPKSMLLGVAVLTNVLVALPKVAESPGVFDHATLVPVVRSPSTQVGELVSQLPEPSAPSGASVPLASQVRLRVWALAPPAAQRHAATAADRHATRD